MWRDRLENRSFTVADASNTMADDGSDVLVVSAKLGFRYDARGKVRITARPVRDYDARDEGGGFRYPRDFSLPYRGTDCLVVGTALPSAAPTESRIVTMTIGTVRKSVRLHGPRVYMKGPRGVRPGPSANIVSTPLRYDFVYGGHEPGLAEEEPANPIGRGFSVDPERWVGLEAHRLEPVDPTLPAAAGCFAPIDAGWSPRREHAGTYSDAWRRKRAPAPPRDRDAHYHSAARPEQRSTFALKLPVTIALSGFIGDDATEIELPAYGIEVLSELHSGTPREHDVSLSRVLVDVDERVVELSFTAHVPLPMKWEKLRRVDVLATESLPPEVTRIPMNGAP